MAIFETGLVYDGAVLVEKKFYSSDLVFDDRFKGGLLTAVNMFVKEAFDTEFDSFTMGEYSLVAISEELSPGDLDKQKSADPTNMILMFSIIERNTSEKAVKDCMRSAIKQFKHRFSIKEISNKNPKSFKKFEKRFDRVFDDLILKPEDQFASIF